MVITSNEPARGWGCLYCNGWE